MKISELVKILKNLDNDFFVSDYRIRLEEEKKEKTVCLSFCRREEEADVYMKAKEKRSEEEIEINENTI